LPARTCRARGCAHADEHLDEVGARDREERHIRLAGDGASEQRLTGAGRADQQHAARDAAAEPLELLRVAQELDDLLRSSFASSTPATSSNVTRPCASVSSFALDLPNPMARPPAPCIWRMKKIHTAMSRNIGNQETSTDRNDIFWSSARAWIDTPRSSSSVT
jgi:hypothetical protein